MLRISVTTRTPRLTALRNALADTQNINEDVCRHFLRQIDENIVRGGSIWEKFPPNQPATTLKRTFEGKDPRAMFGLRGKFAYSTGRTQFTIYSKDPDVVRMQLGPDKRRWVIPARNKPFIAFPTDRIRARGKKTSPGTYSWFFGKSVPHFGWKRRALLPPAEKVGMYTRMRIEELIRIRTSA